jgi:hypothetical protein
MKKKFHFYYLTSALFLGGISTTPAQTLLNSWENSLEGWSILETSTWTSDGFSTTNGVTQGSYSWELTSTAVDYGPTLQGPSSTNLTLLMANASSVNMDIQVGSTPPQFNWGIQIDLHVVQPGGAGDMSVDGGDYPGDVYSPQLTDGSENTLTWPISQAVRTALDAYPHLPCYLVLEFGGGGGGTVYIDNLQVNEIPATEASLWVRELWDDLPGEEISANTSVYDDTSSVGFSATDSWLVNPAETANCALMAFRPGFNNEPLVGANTMGLPGTLDGTFGCMVQDNAHGTVSWTDGDFMTRLLTPDNYINFQASGDYWFSMTIANSPSSLDGQYVSNPASGAGGLGFADGDTTNADFVAIGATGLNILGPDGMTDASKALYISQGTLGQLGDVSGGTLMTTNQTNFIGGPYYISALGTQTVEHVSGDYIVLLGHLKTFGDGTATLDAKYYGIGVGGNPWNTDLDKTTNGIVWDCSYSFNFKGTMTRLLLFQNGQFPFYIFGFRAGANFNQVVGLDPGRIAVSPLTDTYVGYPINMTNLAIEANSYSFASPPAGYGTLNYQWYQEDTNGNLYAISGATSQYLNIASASTNDSAMPLGTDASTYVSVATDPSGTWESVTDSVTVTVTQLNPPAVTSVQMFHNQNSFFVTFNEPGLTGVGDMTHYVFNNGIVVTNVTVVNNSTATEAYLNTTPLPLGTKLTLTISGITNVVGGTLAATNDAFWTDLIQTGAANWDAWQCPAGEVVNAYFNTFVPGNPDPPILQTMALTSWEGPSSGVTIPGLDGYVGDDFGDKLYGWFIPPVTTNYVFFISADDGARLSLSTNDSPTNLFVIACESDWSGADEWTNICDQYPGPGSPHRGDGTATGVVGTTSSGYVWDNSVAGQSPATACIQNRSDQFIVAYWDSSGITGAPGEPAGATDQANWAGAEAPVANCIPPGVTNFWPNVDSNGQALIHLQAGQMYYMQLEHMQNGGGYDESVTYKMAGQPDPNSGVPGTTSGTPSALTDSVIAGTVPFTPTLSIAETGSRPVITYTGVLLAGTSVSGITNVVAQSSASTAISLGGPSQYSPPSISTNMFYRTSE